MLCQDVLSRCHVKMFCQDKGYSRNENHHVRLRRTKPHHTPPQPPLHSLRLTSSTMMELNKIAIPAVYLLIAFLGYPSQILFLYLEPGPLTKNELIASNLLLLFIFITYTKASFVDPGTIPRKSSVEDDQPSPSASRVADEKKNRTGQRTKWCRKCDAAKPPRAHHCKECKR